MQLRGVALERAHAVDDVAGEAVDGVGARVVGAHAEAGDGGYV